MTRRRTHPGSADRGASDSPSLLITHGRAQALTDPAAMKRDWSAALREGLRHAGYDGADRIPIELAFYGDLWRPGAERRERGGKPSEIQQEFARELLKLNRVPAERGGWSTLDALIAAVDSHLRVGEVLLEFFLRDLDEYFEKPSLQARADDRIVQKANALGGRVILLGHSMGTIVGYHALSEHGAELPGLDGLVTFGSPMGMDTLYDRVDELVPGTPYPASLKRWANIWNQKDFATVVHSFGPLFLRKVPGQELVDIEAMAGDPDLFDPGRGHDPLAYLRSSGLARAVVGIVTGEPIPRGPRPAREPELEADGGGHGGRFVAVAPPRERQRTQVKKARAPSRAPKPARPAPRAGDRRGSRAAVTRGGLAAAPTPSPALPPRARPPVATSKTIERSASADFPPVVAPGSDHDLIFSIGREAVYVRATRVMIEVPADAKSVDLRVGVYAPDFEVRTEDDEARSWTPITLPLDDKAQVRGRFHLRANESAQRIPSSIILTFYRGVTPIGQLELDTAIDPKYRGPAGSIHLSMAAAPDPDLTFVVSDRSLGAVGAGPFDVRVSREGAYFERSLGQFAVSVSAVQEAHGLLQDFHDLADEPDLRERVRQIAEIGTRIWWILPDDFRDFYWEEMHGQDLSIAVYSQEPYIPWELVAPQKTKASRPEPMLGISFAISRWTQGLDFPDPIANARMGVVTPQYPGDDDLPSARAEADVLVDQFGASREGTTRDHVRRLLASASVNVVHFSGHGLFDPDVVEHSEIRLEDKPLRPADLPPPNDRQDRAFVFLNACEVAEAGFELTQIGGWARAFCEAGFAGFVGPYWSVNDRVAGVAARTFYGELRAGHTVAEAARSIRRRFETDPDDRGHPSWLAYTVHCQPNVTVAFGGMG